MRSALVVDAFRLETEERKVSEVIPYLAFFAGFCARVSRAVYLKSRHFHLKSDRPLLNVSPFAIISAMSRTQTRAADAAEKLRRKLGDEAVTTEEGRLEELSGDKWFAHRRPDLAVFPKNSEDVAEVMNVASEYRLPVTMRGAGYGYVGGCVPAKGGIVLAMEGMNRIKEINGADFVAVVEPGVITGDLHSAARTKGLYYPPDPASLRNCSIGGNIATNAGGPRCLKYGVTRHYVLGLEVVLANGAIVRCGGRTHKNKTGFDLVGLFVGSEGLLGVVTEATLRLLPFPPARAALSAGFRTMRAAARAIQAVFSGGYLPAAVEVADRFTLEAAREFKPGASFPPGSAHLLLEVDGQPGSVRAEVRALAKLLREQRATAVETATDEVHAKGSGICGVRSPSRSRLPA